jgi:predicted MPP superfamily phosphohydrolase
LFHQGISGFADGIGRQKGYIETVEKLQTKWKQLSMKTILNIGKYHVSQRQHKWDITQTETAENGCRSKRNQSSRVIFGKHRCQENSARVDIWK